MKPGALEAVRDLASFVPGQPPAVRTARRRIAKAAREVKEAKAPALMESASVEVVGLDKYTKDVHHALDASEDPERDAKPFTVATQKAMADLAARLHAAAGRVPAWNGSSITLKPHYSTRRPGDLHNAFPWRSWDTMGDEDANEGADSADVYVHHGSMRAHAPGFTFFGGVAPRASVDDVLDAGDPDFFHDTREEQDYFNLVGELRAPGSSRRETILTLWTARPKRDRARYEKARTIPTGIFLSNSADDAGALAHDLPDSARDLWRVEVSSRYLVQTLDHGRLAHYQAVAPGSEVPVKDIEMVSALSEVSFTAAEPTEWRGTTALFTVGDTDYRVRMIPRDGWWLTEVLFEARTSGSAWTMGITGTGSPIRVLSSVISSVIDFLHAHPQVRALMFVAKGRGRTGTYAKLARLMARKFVWQLASEVKDDHGVFVLAKHEEALGKAVEVARGSLHSKWVTRGAEKKIAALQAQTAALRRDEAREGSFDVNVTGTPYSFSLDLSFSRGDRQSYAAPEKGKTKGLLIGYLSYHGPSFGHDASPDDFLDDDDASDLLVAASKKVGAKLSWSEQSWSRVRDHWSRAVASAQTMLTEAKTANGDCYEAAVTYLTAHGGLLGIGPKGKKGLLLVHGEVTGQGPPPPEGVGGVLYGHAWIEDGSTVIDTSNGRNIVMPKALYYALGRIGKNVHRYTVEEVRVKLRTTRVYGPWDLQTSTGL